MTELIASHRLSSRKPLRAFLVEDNPSVRANLIAALEDMAPVVVVDTAADEQTAVRKLTAGNLNVDLAIIDIFLAQGSGMGLLQTLQGARSPCERVVLTNYANADVRRHCLALGASKVFDKSSEIDALVDHCMLRTISPSASIPGAKS